MRPPQVAIDFGTPPGSPSRTSSDDFERVPYPPDHHKSQQVEELPLHYMNEDKARRRGVVRGGPEPTGHEVYDDDGKDVYAKLRPFKGRAGSGRLRRAPPPPPTTIVSIYCFNLYPLTFWRRGSFSYKTSSMCRQPYTPSFHAGPASTKSEKQASSSGTKPTLENSAHTTSSASSTSTYTHRWARCSSGWRVCYQATMAILSSRAGWNMALPCRTWLCGS